MELTAVLTRAEEGGFIALNPETGTTTQGETVEDAVANLKEATALYLTNFRCLCRTPGHHDLQYSRACLSCLICLAPRSSERWKDLGSS